MSVKNVSVNGAANAADGNAEQKPKEKEGEADLTEQMVGEIAVIPHAKPKPQIDDAARKELNGGDQERSEEGADDKQIFHVMLVDLVNGKKADRAAECHGPMRIAPKEQLNAGVSEPANEEQKRNFHKPLCKVL